MAIRNRQQINIIYVHLDLTVGSTIVRDALDEMTVQHESRGSFILSVNQNVDNTQAIVKVVAQDNFTVGRSWMAAVIRAYRENEHDLVRSIVNTPGWYPDLQDA